MSDKYLFVAGEFIKRPNYVEYTTQGKLKKYIEKHNLKHNGIFLTYKGKT